MTVTELKKLLEKAEGLGYGEAEVKRFAYALLGNEVFVPIAQAIMRDQGRDLLPDPPDTNHYELRLT